MVKRKLKLNALEGNAECFLEVELFENGDMNIGLRGQNTRGEIHYICAQIPNPTNGGGNPDDYKILGQIYEVLKRQK